MLHTYVLSTFSGHNADLCFQGVNTDKILIVLIARRHLNMQGSNHYSGVDALRRNIYLLKVAKLRKAETTTSPCDRRRCMP